jgi:transcriptional regulator GlxA family with amidase domain
VAPAYVHLLAAKDLIDRGYAEPLDTARLARTALTSEFHFIRSFRRAFGETPRQYLRRRRIERAQELLRGTDEPITDICLAVGFQSLGSFSDAFRRIAGEPPSEYRDRHRSAATPAVPACWVLMATRPTENDGESATFEKQEEAPAS